MAKQQGALRDRTREFTNFPKNYKVIFHNDDFTTMQFVVELLVTVFFKTEREATAIMLEVHEQGRGQSLGRRMMQHLPILKQKSRR